MHCTVLTVKGIQCVLLSYTRHIGPTTYNSFYRPIGTSHAKEKHRSVKQKIIVVWKISQPLASTRTSCVPSELWD